MKMKVIAASIAVVLGLGGAVTLGVGGASAHDHTDAITCQFASVDLANYDGAATVKVTLDGVVVKDTAPFGGQYHYNQPLTFDASHTSHTLITEVISQDQGYSFTHTDVTPANCYVPPTNVPILPAVFHPATCAAASSYDVPVQDARVKYALDSNNVRPVAGNNQPLADGVSVTIAAHVTAEAVQGGAAPNDYTVTFTGQKQIHNASCVPAQVCTIAGTAYHEGDDHSFVLTPEGYDLRSKHDGHATGLLFPAHGNLQGITAINYTTTNVVGNGVFFRIIVDLSADGGSSYNSLSVVGNSITQASIADVGSKNVFLGKTIAQIADLYPDAVYTSLGWATGSAYAAGDGATITAFSGDCGSGSFIPTVPETTHRTTTVTGETTCTEGGVGGGSFPTTVTNYTTTGVWNTDKQAYDLVETTDEGYPVTTYTTTPASLESCPISATPVDPTVKAVCDADDTITLASTDNIAYAITNQTKTGADVTATPADATVLATATGWTANDAGVATFHVTFDNTACPVTLTVQKDGTLAFTGSDPTILLMVMGALLLMGIVIVLAVRHSRKEDERELV